MLMSSAQGRKKAPELPVVPDRAGFPSVADQDKVETRFVLDLGT